MGKKTSPFGDAFACGLDKPVGPLPALFLRESKKKSWKLIG